VNRRVRFDRQARADLAGIYRYIRDETGIPSLARAYVDRLYDQCLRLGLFPERGTRRPELRPGLRVIGFERRAVIVFVIEETSVRILRVLYGGRDLTTLNEGE
jgi:toxin ParE1/3/4